MLTSVVFINLVFIDLYYSPFDTYLDQTIQTLLGYLNDTMDCIVNIYLNDTN